MKKKLLILIILLIVVLAFIYYQNNCIQKTYISYRNEQLPESFENFRIMHVSDLHNKSFGQNQEKLINEIKVESPDIIVITGDLIDRRKYDLETALTFIEEAVTVAPVYYVNGNHEAWSGNYKIIKNALMSLGVQVLDNESVNITNNKESIEIIGIKDPGFYTPSHAHYTTTEPLEKYLKEVGVDDQFQILLSHRPELFDLYVNHSIDLTFSGHAHGGQFRLPLIGGLFAPNQGFLPTYTNGLYEQKKSTMIVSRGLGNSVIPIRLFNRPQLIVVTLNKK